MDAALRTSNNTINTIVFSFVPSAITQPFFELQTPDFAWKFVWTVPTNYEKKIVKKKKIKKNLKFGHCSSY